jgi:hypothetical protein
VILVEDGENIGWFAVVHHFFRILPFTSLSLIFFLLSLTVFSFFSFLPWEQLVPYVTLPSGLGGREKFPL